MVPAQTMSHRKSLKVKPTSGGTERAAKKSMILLVTSCRRAGECAAALQRELGHPAEVAGTLRQALQQVRRQGFAAVVVDESQAEADVAAAEALYRDMDGGVAVTLNLAISGTERVVREVRGALRRRQADWRQAQAAAVRQLRSEVSDAVTGILLSSQMALEATALPVSAAEHVRAVYELAASLQQRLTSERPGRG